MYFHCHSKLNLKYDSNWSIQNINLFTNIILLQWNVYLPESFPLDRYQLILNYCWFVIITHSNKITVSFNQILNINLDIEKKQFWPREKWNVECWMIFQLFWLLAVHSVTISFNLSQVNIFRVFFCWINIGLELKINMMMMTVMMVMADWVTDLELSGQWKDFFVEKLSFFSMFISFFGFLPFKFGLKLGNWPAIGHLAECFIQLLEKKLFILDHGKVWPHWN